MTALEYPAVLGEMCVVIIWMEVDEAWMQGPYVLVNRCVHDSGRMQDRINVYGAVIRVNVDQYRVFFFVSIFVCLAACASRKRIYG